ncbi:hypothetical protein BD408DRAFT_45088 [Parasitella parasitica]|nr:hypothetical protein BD408DRAFT_45088 [Parasitella parasitica]
MPARFCCIIPLRGGIIISGVIMFVVSVALLGATFTHRNPMIIHLSLVHAALPWIYIGFLIATAVISLYTIASGAIARLGMMRSNKFLLWLLVFFLTIWEAVSFILALVNRSKALSACEAANTSSSPDSTSANNTTFSVAGYSTTFLGMEMVGQLLMFYAATIVGSYTAKLRERKLGHRLRDLEWDDNLDELASSYRADARNAPKYPLNDLKKKKKGFFNFGSKK